MTTAFPLKPCPAGERVFRLAIAYEIALLKGRDQGYGQRTVGGIEDRMDSMLPPVLRPKIVPRS